MDGLSEISNVVPVDEKRFLSIMDAICNKHRGIFFLYLLFVILFLVDLLVTIGSDEWKEVSQMVFGILKLYSMNRHAKIREKKKPKSSAQQVRFSLSVLSWTTILEIDFCFFF